ncbi:unnamed protein product [Clonostachys chloroleuca]|uniref:Uncharacterized protein n=1 Tax=Clonostachys chloroleuca TaxID=1926264 RepID=A0AA35PZR7_9HYPO|nr:unnamed protein product [Clonostachys chloroleuca]
MEEFMPKLRPSRDAMAPAKKPKYGELLVCLSYQFGYVRVGSGLDGLSPRFMCHRGGAWYKIEPKP